MKLLIEISTDEYNVLLRKEYKVRKKHISKIVDKMDWFIHFVKIITEHEKTR